MTLETVLEYETSIVPAAEYFDKISESYRDLEIEEMVLRRYSEVYTLKTLLGDLTGKHVLDLGCSDGYFTRLCKQWGAAKAVGVDLSPDMIALAREIEAANPLGNRYFVGDTLDLEQLGHFDIAFIPFTLNYAPSKSDLLTMCQNAHKNLKPHGRLLSMNDHPDLQPDPEEKFAKYGKLKTFTPPLQDGTILTITLIAPTEAQQMEAVSFTDYYYTASTLEWALQSAGFAQIAWHPTLVSPEGIEKYGREFWSDYLAHPSVVFLECVRG